MTSARTQAPAMNHGIVFIALVNPRRTGRRLASRQPEWSVAGTPSDETRDEERDRDDPEHDGECPADLAGEVECDHAHRDERADDAVDSTHVLRHGTLLVRDSSQSRSSEMLHEEGKAGEHGQTQQTRRHQLGYGGAWSPDHRRGETAGWLRSVRGAVSRPALRSGASRGSAPSQYRPFAMMQYAVAANHTIAVPTKPVNRSHHGLCTSDSTDATEMLIPTAR